MDTQEIKTIHQTRAIIIQKIKDSVLLPEKVQPLLITKVEKIEALPKLNQVLIFLEAEKKFILTYLRKVIDKDTKGLTVIKLRHHMQKAYLERMVKRESQEEKIDKDAAPDTLEAIQ